MEWHYRSGVQPPSGWSKHRRSASSAPRLLRAIIREPINREARLHTITLKEITMISGEVSNQGLFTRKLIPPYPRIPHPPISTEDG